MSTEIRVAGAADRTRVLELLRAQLSDHAIRPSDAALEHAVDGLLEAHELGRILIATVGERIVGLAVIAFSWTLEHGGLSVWLDELYVEPECRGCGIGTALLRAAREAALSAGAKAMDLEVEAGHERAANLYRREGFVPLERQQWTLPLARR